MLSIIPIGADHAGFTLKEAIKTHFKGKYTFDDKGTFSEESVHYPSFAHQVAEAISNQKPLGILICGSANGVAITANKHQNIRAAICWTPEIARLARQHNDANIICLPARFITEEIAIEMVSIFMNEPFEGGRHSERIAMISL